MSKIEVIPNVLDDSRKGTQHEMDRGVYVRLAGPGPQYGKPGAAISVDEARVLADELNDLAEQIEARFEERKARPLGLGMGSIVRLHTGPTLVLDDPRSERQFRVVANGAFVPGTSSTAMGAPRWAASSVKSAGYEVLVRQ